MIVEIKVPSPGESITEVVISRWIKKDGDYVEKDEELAEIESDKATLTINAEQAGSLKVMAAEGDTVKVGDVVCKIDTDAKAPADKPKAAEAPAAKQAAPIAAKQEAAAPAAAVADKKKETYANGVP